MKYIFEFFDNTWALAWFIFGLVFFVLGTISAVNNETEKSLACLAMCMGCHARCEVKILQRKIEKDK